MTSRGHDLELLGAYALGALEAAEARPVEEHLAGCGSCRHELHELRTAAESLGELPPEVLLDGPPEHGALALQRALGQADSERRTQTRRRGVLLTLAAAAAAAILLGGGILAGRALAPAADPNDLPPVAAGGVVAAQEDPATGAAATVMLEPTEAGLALESLITGIPAGEDCEVVVVAGDGSSEVAATWTVTEEAEAGGSRPEGTVGFAPQEVDTVVVRDTEQREFVTVLF